MPTFNGKNLLCTSTIENTSRACADSRPKTNINCLFSTITRVDWRIADKGAKARQISASTKEAQKTYFAGLFALY
jgi:hypothetical protein